MPCCWRRRAVPPGARSRFGSNKLLLEQLFLSRKAASADAAQCFGLREADSVHPLSQISQGFSERGAVLDGNKSSKVVPRPLLLFFRTLICGFQLQHHGTLLPEHASQRQLCSRWATTSSYDACTAAGRCPCHVHWPAACFRAAPSSSSSSAIRFGVLSGSTLDAASSGAHADRLCALCAC